MTKETQALIEAAEQAYEALRWSYNVTDYPADGDTTQDHAMTALRAAISSAKAAEEGVETKYRVINKHLAPWWCETFGSEGEAARYFRKPSNRETCTRIERLDTYTTVIEVMENS